MVAPLIRIVDDDPQVSESLRFVLSIAGFDVCAYAGAEDFLSNDSFERPGCVLLDIRMPGMSGLECQNELIARHADLPVVFLSAHADISMAVNAVQKGASGFLVKPPRPDELTEQIQKAVALHEKRLRMRRELAQIEQQLAGLTPAEYDTALLIAKGLSNADIADILRIAEGTVRHRRVDIGNKLDARNAVEVSELFRWLDALKGELP